MPFLFINKTLRLNNIKARTAMNANISVFVICTEVIIYLLLLNLHGCNFNKCGKTRRFLWICSRLLKSFIFCEMILNLQICYKRNPLTIFLVRVTQNSWTVDFLSWSQSNCRLQQRPNMGSSERSMVELLATIVKG